MLRDRRIWWGTVAVFAGIGAALLTGSGTAAADTGGSAEHSGASTSQSSTSSNSPRRLAAATGTTPRRTRRRRLRHAHPEADRHGRADDSGQPSRPAPVAPRPPAKILVNVLSAFGVAGPTTTAGRAGDRHQRATRRGSVGVRPVGGHPAGHQRRHRRQGRAFDADDPGRRRLQRAGRLVFPDPGRRFGAGQRGHLAAARLPRRQGVLLGAGHPAGPGHQLHRGGAHAAVVPVS